MPEQLTDYDQVPYPSYTHPQTHPDRLSVIGRLFGLGAAPIDRCRVLEVGCGDGTNLAPMAWALPRSKFVGVDLASLPIERGQRMVRDLGMTNLVLQQGNLTELGTDFGQFDYIIAHGLYSWVPVEVRNDLLKLCRTLLAPQGIAFISYNALPGGHLRLMAREMMLFHVRGAQTADERMRQAMALVKFLAEAQDTRDAYRAWMKDELERILAHDPGHLHHDELGRINDPIYFAQFMDHAARHGLQYLGDADFLEMSDHIFSESVQQTLSQLTNSRLLREQYLDFLKCRCFRQTLLCQGEARLHNEPQAEPIAGFLIASPAVCTPAPPNLSPGVNCVFETPKGGSCQTDLPAGKAALSILGAAWPTPLPFDELFRLVCQRLAREGLVEDAEASRQRLCQFLLRLYAGRSVEFHTFVPPMARQAGERPVAHPVARWQAGHGDLVSSLFHVTVRVQDEIARSLLIWLDGTLERKALLEKLWAFLQTKKSQALPSDDEAAARRDLEANLDKNLEKLARLGLLLQ
jgi:SAM-dependent methyltransferase